MAEKSLKGTNAISKALENIAHKMGNGEVSIGFMEEAKYPDGTPVAAVAFWNEFGGVTRPPRPFFRQMIAKESPNWAMKMASLAKVKNYDGVEVLETMGTDIEGALQQSINEFSSPPLATSTVAAKGFDKPLIASTHMLNSVTHVVKK